MSALARTRSFSLFIAFVLLQSCDPWFSYSPYSAVLEEHLKNNTEKNLALINAMDAGDSKPFKVALLSDPHYHYAKLSDAIAEVNRKGDYDFAIVTGDLTDNGLRQEFVYFHEVMQNLKIPYIALIGNHDYLSNGELVYDQMFGRRNFAFVFNNVKFVMFDNTTIESNRIPDMEWFAKALENDHGYDYVIPFSHIPPYDGQMADYASKFHDALVSNGIKTSIHGHKHDFSCEETFGDAVEYITVSSPQKRTFAELIVGPQGVEVHMQKF